MQQSTYAAILAVLCLLPEASSGEADPLLGKWKVVEFDGKEQPASNEQVFQFLKKGRIVVEMARTSEDGRKETTRLEGTYVTCRDANPNQMTIALTDMFTGGRKMEGTDPIHGLAIYKLEENRLTLNMNEEVPLKFPADFELRGHKSDLTVMARVGAGAASRSALMPTLRVSPGPVRRGTTMQWIASYAVVGTPGKVIEKWVLLKDGKELFKPRRKVIELRPGGMESRIDFPFPSGDKVQAGKYTVRLQAALATDEDESKLKFVRKECTFEAE